MGLYLLQFINYNNQSINRKMAVVQKNFIHPEAQSALKQFGIESELNVAEAMPPGDAFTVLKSSKYCEFQNNSYVINLKEYCIDHPDVPKIEGNFHFTDGTCKRQSFLWQLFSS